VFCESHQSIKNEEKAEDKDFENLLDVQQKKKKRKKDKSGLERQ
jgi:hypothetical protein